MVQKLWNVVKWIHQNPLPTVLVSWCVAALIIIWLFPNGQPTIKTTTDQKVDVITKAQLQEAQKTIEELKKTIQQNERVISDLQTKRNTRTITIVRKDGTKITDSRTSTETSHKTDDTKTTSVVATKDTTTTDTKKEDTATATKVEIKTVQTVSPPKAWIVSGMVGWSIEHPLELKPASYGVSIQHALPLLNNFYCGGYGLSTGQFGVTCSVAF